MAKIRHFVLEKLSDIGQNKIADYFKGPIPDCFCLQMDEEGNKWSLDIVVIPIAFAIEKAAAPCAVPEETHNPETESIIPIYAKGWVYSTFYNFQRAILKAC